MKNVIFLPLFALFCLVACKTEMVTTGCDTKKLKSIDFNGPLYVQPVGSPGFTDTHDWQGAIDYCNNLDFDGCDDWYLPSSDELNALYLKKADVGDFSGVTYWSSTISSAGRAWNIDFSSNWYTPDYTYNISRCRCVRR